MKLVKYIVLIGAVCAAFTLQPAKADTFTSSLDFGNSAISGFLPAGEQFGTVTVTLISGGAEIKFVANTASGFFFVDTNAAAVNLAQPPGNPTLVLDPNFDHFNNPPNTDQVDGIGTFNLRVQNKSASVLVGTIIFDVTGSFSSPADVLVADGDGFDAAAHISIPGANNGAGVTGFAGEKGGGLVVPDSGATAMLLGLGLSGLGFVRRFVKR